ncbi:L-rhamnose-binding lectin CSL2-like [Alosa pseudoharengus]|uniref:L-rhamnose-binding lectin CSL2-like n=1 Tax=Alosa pseudoharengus TaxID=34774 RepID=UPI003F8BB6B9
MMLNVLQGSNVIHIHDANYGRTDETTCSAGRPAHQLSNTNCYAPTTLPIIRESCEGRSTCAVQASHHIFTDPCFGIYKYLQISYSCVPPPSIKRTSQTCESLHGNLDCGLYSSDAFLQHLLICFTCLQSVLQGSNVIHIHDANYGRTDETTCSAGRPAHQLSNTNCYAPTTLPIIMKSCEGRSTCAVQASHLIFTDPCVGIYKYLQISYSCVPPAARLPALPKPAPDYYSSQLSLNLLQIITALPKPAPDYYSSQLSLNLLQIITAPSSP